MGQKLHIDPYFWLFCALLLYILPVNWTLGIFTASVVHELFHIMAVIKFHGYIHQMRLKPSGLIIYADAMPLRESVICTLAGPAGSLLLIFFSKKIPVLAICGWIQGIFNLLPLYPLDGGRVLYMLLSAYCPENLHGIMGAIEMIVLAVILIILYGITRSVALPVMVAILIFAKRKFSCKDSIMAVQ